VTEQLPWPNVIPQFSPPTRIPENSGNLSHALGPTGDGFREGISLCKRLYLSKRSVVIRQNRDNWRLRQGRGKLGGAEQIIIIVVEAGNDGHPQN